MNLHCRLPATAISDSLSYNSAYHVPSIAPSVALNEQSLAFWSSSTAFLSLIFGGDVIQRITAMYPVWILFLVDILQDGHAGIVCVLSGAVW